VKKLVEIIWIILALLAALIVCTMLWLLCTQRADAAASKGLAWDAVTTYEDGSAIEASAQVAYTVYDSAGKFVLGTLNTSAAASKLPADGCYVVTAALYSATTNSKIAGTEGDPTPNAACTSVPVAPPPPPVKRLGSPGNLRVQ